MVVGGWWVVGWCRWLVGGWSTVHAGNCGPGGKCVHERPARHHALLPPQPRPTATTNHQPPPTRPPRPRLPPRHNTRYDRTFAGHRPCTAWLRRGRWIWKRPKWRSSAWGPSARVLHDCCSTMATARPGMPAARCGWRRSWYRDVTQARDVDLPTGILSNDLSRITKNREIKVVAQLIGGLEPARTIMLELLAKRQGRGDGQQGLAGRARPGAVRHGARTGPVDRLRGVGGGRHSDHRHHQPVPVGQPDPVAPRDPQRHEQLHPHPDGGGDGLRRGRGRGPAAGLCRGESGDGRRRHRRRAEAGDPGPPGVWRAGALARHPAAGHRHARTRPTCAMPRNWAIASSCWPWPS